MRIAHDDTRRAELADTTHAMNTGRHGFQLVAERREEIEEAAPAFAPLIYRRAAAAVCTVSGVRRRACVVRRV